MTVIARMNVGGPAKLIHYLDHQLIESGIQHILVTGYCESNEIDFLNTHQIRGQLYRLARTKRSINLLSDFLSVYELSKIIKKTKPNIIHTHTAKAGFIGRIAKLISGQKNIRIVHTFHGHLLYGYFGKISSLIFNCTEKILAKNTDVLIAVSNNVKNDLITAGIGNTNKWRVIYPGIEIPVTFSNNRDSSSPLALLWIGRFSKVKNPMLAIKAYEKILPVIASKFTMVGGGELLNECLDYSRRHNLNIEFTGWDTDIYKYLEVSNLLLLTSFNEGLPLVVLEAASRCIPTLATNVGGVEEFIQDGETGFMSEVSLGSYSNKLISLVEKPEEIKKIGNNAFNKIEKGFNLEQFCNMHIELYRSLNN